MNRLVVILLFAVALSGCVVTQTRDGRYQFGFVEPGQTVAEFPSASGRARLRRHLDGTYGLYFPDRMSQYRIGKYDRIDLVVHHSDGDRTAALFERTRGNCVSYELVTITRDQVGRNPVRVGCQSRVDAAVVDGSLVMRERVDQQARLWVWTQQGIRSGREPPPPRVAAPSRPAPQRTVRQQAPARQTASTASRASAGGTASAPAPRSAPVAPSQIQLPPPGSISREVEAPVTVVLERGG